MTQLELFRMLAPEFAGIPDDQIGMELSLYAEMVNEKRFRRQYDRAVVLLTAHYIKLYSLMNSDEQGSGSSAIIAGQVVMEKEGDLQRQYANTAGNTGTNANTVQDDLLRKTAYGMMYLDLVARCIVPVLTRGGW